MTQDNEHDELVGVIMYGRCRCGKVGTEMHTCPFAEEIYSDSTECNCCDICAGNCADDI